MELPVLFLSGKYLILKIERGKIAQDSEEKRVKNENSTDRFVQNEEEMKC